MLYSYPVIDTAFRRERQYLFSAMNAEIVSFARSCFPQFQILFTLQHLINATMLL